MTLANPVAAPGNILDKRQADALDAYCSMLLKWNRAMNLTGAKNREQLWSNLLADSFELAPFMDRLFSGARENLAVWDLGAGAGLPGIPLRIVWQKGTYIMIESRQKRAIFLENVLARLKLPSVSVFAGRAEDFFRTEKTGAGCILSRAFMPWEKLLEFCAPYLAPDGILIILGSKPAPALPPGWRLAAEHSYAAASHARWFWALKRQRRN